MRLAIGVVGASLLLATIAAQRGPAAGEWRYYGGTPGSLKYSPLDQITRGNAGRLRVAWRWPSPDNAIAAAGADLTPGAYEDTPLMANGVLYTITALGLLAAVDPTSGATIWQYDPETYKAGGPPILVSCTGASRSGPTARSIDSSPAPMTPT